MKEGNGACLWLNRLCSLIIMKTNVKTLVANVVMEWMLVDVCWMLHRIGFQYRMTFNIEVPFFPLVMLEFKQLF